MLRVFTETLVATAFSLLALYFIEGSFYTLIAVTTMIAWLLMIYSAQGLFSNRDSAPTWVWMLTTTALGITIGALWPSIPVIILWRARDQRLRRQNHTACVTSPNCNNPNCRYRS